MKKKHVNVSERQVLMIFFTKIKRFVKMLI